MHPLVSLLAIVVLFFIIGRLAGVVVGRARALGTRLGIGTFFLGVLLGLFTSAPEATIAINAAAQQAPDLSAGNFIGGTVVLFALIAGLLAVRSKKLVVSEGVSGLAAGALYLLLPVLFALDGTLSVGEGILLAFGYFGVLLVVYGASRKQGFHLPHPHLTNHSVQDLGLLLAGTAGIAIAAAFIVRLTVPLAQAFGVPELAIGVLAYSLGTNLPELVVAVRASSKPDALPVATLFGSALANPFLLGLLAIGVRSPLHFDGGFMGVALCYAAIVILFFYFARTGRQLSRLEGVILILLYAAFAAFSVQLG